MSVDRLVARFSLDLPVRCMRPPQCSFDVQAGPSPRRRRGRMLAPSTPAPQSRPAEPPATGLDGRTCNPGKGPPGNVVPSATKGLLVPSGRAQSVRSAGDGGTDLASSGGCGLDGGRPHRLRKRESPIRGNPRLRRDREGGGHHPVLARRTATAQLCDHDSRRSFRSRQRVLGAGSISHDCAGPAGHRGGAAGGTGPLHRDESVRVRGHHCSLRTPPR